MPVWPDVIWSVPVIGAAAIAAWTDFRRGLIYDVLTYPGMLAGLLLHTLRDGPLGMADSLAGWLALGGMMAASLALCPGVGGGDVKLMAMLGGFLGLERGLETLLWTCSVAVLQVLCRLLSMAGLTGTLQVLRSALFGRREDAVNENREQVDRLLAERLRLGPAAFLALLIVLGETWFRQWTTAGL